jgi:hypothetical protein
MTYKIITDDTGEEVCCSAIRSALDPTMKNLCEDPIEIIKDPISLEDILSPAEAISTKIKSDSMNDVQGLYFRKPSAETMEDEQGRIALIETAGAKQSSLCTGGDLFPSITISCFVSSIDFASKYNMIWDFLVSIWCWSVKMNIGHPVSKSKFRTLVKVNLGRRTSR